VRRHLKTGELAFHYCHVPEGQLLAKTRLIRAAGLPDLLFLGAGALWTCCYSVVMG
jgi:hypothetical protein